MRFEIIGRKCETLVAREFWFCGELVTPLCVVFIGDNKGDRWKLYLDDEDNTWKIEKTDENPNDLESDEEYRYPLTDLLERFPLREQIIEDFCECDKIVSAKAEIKFANGHSLEFTHNYTSEEDTVTMKKSR